MQDRTLVNLTLIAPVPAIPVHYFHSFEQPFCANPDCLCQLDRQATLALFTQIVEGKLELEKASQLSGKTV